MRREGKTEEFVGAVGFFVLVTLAVVLMNLLVRGCAHVVGGVM